MDAEYILQNYHEYFSQSNFLFDFLRTVGWGIVNLLRMLCSGAEGLFNACYDFLDITQNPVFTSFYEEFRPLFVISLVVSIMLLGLYYMYSDKRPPVLKNAFLGLIILFGASTFTGYLNEAIQSSRSALMEDTNMTDNVIKANIADLLYLDNNDWAFDSASLNGLTTDGIDHMDVSEHVTKKSDASSLGREIFNTKFEIDKDGDLKAEKMGTKGWFDIFEPPYYYRYRINFFQICFLLIVDTLVIAIASYKVFRIITELLIGGIAGALFAADITSGQKTKKVIENFFHCYLCLFFILVSFRLYAIYIAYINNQGWGPITRLFMILFASLVVVDGPNVIEKLFGMDIGLSNEVYKAAALARFGAMSTPGAKSAMGSLGNLLNNSFGMNKDSKVPSFATSNNTNPNTNKSGDTKEPEVGPATKSDASNSSSNSHNEPNINYSSPGSSNYSPGNSNYSPDMNDTSVSENSSDDTGQSPFKATDIAQPEDINQNPATSTQQPETNPDNPDTSEQNNLTQPINQADNMTGTTDNSISATASNSQIADNPEQPSANNIPNQSQLQTDSATPDNSLSATQQPGPKADTGHVSALQQSAEPNINKSAPHDSANTDNIKATGSEQKPEYQSTPNGQLKTGVSPESSSRVPNIKNDDKGGESFHSPNSTGGHNSESSKNEEGDKSHPDALQSHVQPKDNKNPENGSDSMGSYNHNPEAEKQAFLDQKWSATSIKPGINSIKSESDGQSHLNRNTSGSVEPSTSGFVKASDANNGGTSSGNMDQSVSKSLGTDSKESASDSFRSQSGVKNQAAENNEISSQGGGIASTVPGASGRNTMPEVYNPLSQADSMAPMADTSGASGRNAMPEVYNPPSQADSMAPMADTSGASGRNTMSEVYNPPSQAGDMNHAVSGSETKDLNSAVSLAGIQQNAFQQTSPEAAEPVVKNTETFNTDTSYAYTRNGNDGQLPTVAGQEQKAPDAKAQPKRAKKVRKPNDTKK